MKSKVLKRIVFGSIMIALLCGLFWFGWRLEKAYADEVSFSARLLPFLPTAVVLLALVLAGFREMQVLARAADVHVLSVTGMLTCALLGTIPWWTRAAGLDLDGALLALMLGAALATCCLEQMIRYRTDAAFIHIGATLLGIVYLGVGGLLIFHIRMFGVPHLVLFLAAAKFTDIGAYFTGTAIGKHKMIPWLSPGKSWEGLAGGMLTAAAMSVLVSWALGIALASWQAALFGGIVALAGQFADLCESLLKRSADVKDSAGLVPEFGGVLDLLDSVLLSAPAALLLLRAWA